MARKLPTVENVLAALPAVQGAVKREIAARIAAGEAIAALDVKKQHEPPRRGGRQGGVAKRKSAA